MHRTSVQHHLAKLSVHAPGYEIRSTHGTIAAGIVWEDVAAAIAQIRRPSPGGPIADILVQHLLLYHWGGQDHVRDVLVAELVAEISKIAVTDAWRPKNRPLPPGTIRTLCECALEEFHTAQGCRECAGSGFEHVDLIDSSKNRTCEICRGAGRLWWSRRRRSRRCGYGKDVWRRTWNDRYLRVLERIQTLERRGLRRLGRLLRLGDGS